MMLVASDDRGMVGGAGRHPHGAGRSAPSPVVAGFLWLACGANAGASPASCRCSARSRSRSRRRARTSSSTPTATAVAVRGADGALSHHRRQGRDRFDVENWLRADADPREPRTDAGSARRRCDRARLRRRAWRRRQARRAGAQRRRAFARRLPARASWSSVAYGARRLRDQRRVDRSRGAAARRRPRALPDAEADGGPGFRIETAYPGSPPAVHAAAPAKPQ